METKLKPVIVGSDNPHSPDPSRALEVDNPRSAGGRLMALSGLSRDQYLRSFRRVNAIDKPELPPQSFCLVLGRDAWRMLGLPLPNHQPMFSTVQKDECTFLLLPHPSGRNLLLNDPLTKCRIRDVLRSAARRSGCVD